MVTKTQLTKKGLEALEKELGVLLEEKRPRLVKRLANARTQGDLSENNDYQAAREELEFLDGRIAELQEVIGNATVINASRSKATQVDIGTKVKIKANGKELEYFIVGEWEADPSTQKISHTSPLGKALLGKKVGEKVEVEAPAGKVIYEILRIN